MQERLYDCGSGTIHYWVTSGRLERKTMVFLPGLTAEHHLFDRQIEAFQDEYQILTWDAPGHGLSRPFSLDFSLMDKAAWLHEILERERIQHPVLIGQSMGGYVSQCFMERYRGEAEGFISIDSAPIQRAYMPRIEIAALKRTETMYRMYPWERLRIDAARGCSETAPGRAYMEKVIGQYTRDEYCRLAGHGFRILAEAIEADLPYRIDCPAMLICGCKDRAGFTKRYNRQWADETKLPVHWIEGAGHNSNMDCPDEVNDLIRAFVRKI